MSADERREDILVAAVVEFAQGGLHGTSTEAIAARAGVSQPYLFRLFGTKRDLFLATVERAFDKVADAFEAAAVTTDGNPLKAMGDAYIAMLPQHDFLLLQLHAYAAAGDRDVQAVVRRRFAELYQLVERLSGADDFSVREFFAHGMLLTVAAAIDLPELTDTEGWARRCLGLDETAL